LSPNSSKNSYFAFSAIITIITNLLMIKSNREIDPSQFNLDSTCYTD
jgi:hypothetical protein